RVAPCVQREIRLRAELAEQRLTVPAVPYRDLREEDGTPSRMADADAVCRGIDLVRGDHERRRQHGDLDAEAVQLLGRERREARTARRGGSRHARDEDGERSLRLHAADATAELRSAVERHEDARGYGEPGRNVRARLERRAACGGGERRVRDGDE